MTENPPMQLLRQFLAVRLQSYSGARYEVPRTAIGSERKTSYDIDLASTMGDVAAMLVKRCEATEAKPGKTILAFSRAVVDVCVKYDRVNEQVHVKTLPVLPARSQRRSAAKYDSFRRNEIEHNWKKFAEGSPRSCGYFQFSVNHGNFMLAAQKAAFLRITGHAEHLSHGPRRHLDGS